jgi:hypothetical protein
MILILNNFCFLLLLCLRKIIYFGHSPNVLMWGGGCGGPPPWNLEKWEWTRWHLKHTGIHNSCSQLTILFMIFQKQTIFVMHFQKQTIFFMIFQKQTFFSPKNPSPPPQNQMVAALHVHCLYLPISRWQFKTIFQIFYSSMHIPVGHIAIVASSASETNMQEETRTARTDWFWPKDL